MFSHSGVCSAFALRVLGQLELQGSCGSSYLWARLDSSCFRTRKRSSWGDGLAQSRNTFHANSARKLARERAKSTLGTELQVDGKHFS